MARILIVDDSQTILKMILHYLKDEGHELVTAEDGRIAYDAFENDEGNFQLVLTDINMPNMNGFELTEKIRTGTTNEKVPIVVLSTEESDKSKEEGKKMGVSAWVVKPPQAETLVKVVKHFLG